MALEGESVKLLGETIKTIRVVSNEQLQISKVIEGVVKMQHSLSDRMDRAEKENREAHASIMKDIREFREEVRLSIAKLNGGIGDVVE